MSGQVTQLQRTVAQQRDKVSAMQEERDKWAAKHKETLVREEVSTHTLQFRTEAHAHAGTAHTCAHLSCGGMCTHTHTYTHTHTLRVYVLTG